jgi:hypothetical protein
MTDVHAVLHAVAEGTTNIFVHITTKPAVQAIEVWPYVYGVL